MRKIPLAPWCRHPELSPTHLGWRMGYGEAHLIELSHWLGTLNDIDRQEWLRSIRPIPKEWMEWAVECYASPEADDDQLDAAWEVLSGTSG